MSIEWNSIGDDPWLDGGALLHLSTTEFTPPAKMIDYIDFDIGGTVYRAQLTEYEFEAGVENKAKVKLELDTKGDSLTLFEGDHIIAEMNGEIMEMEIEIETQGLEKFEM